jgi:hypothetical protein
MKAMVGGAMMVLYGILANIYAGRIKNDGQEYKPGRLARVWTIILGGAILLFGLYRSR